jgi:CheY-like chemotaxis protein
MKLNSAEELAQRALELELVSAADLQEAWAELGGHHVPVEQLGLALVRRELLTGFQLDRLQRGEQTGFFYGRAKILYQVGAGSFARVYRAIDVDSGGIVAVKVLRGRYSADPEKCNAFRREGEVGRRLRHPNIVAIRDVGQAGKSSYITMEFIEGQTLRELVRIRGAFDVDRGLGLILQMIAGLEYAHQRGVTHRDLKASNILISSTGQAKLVDFGLAGIEQSGDKALERMENARTIDYATLEKLSGVKDDGIRSDIYFLGTLAYLTLAGAPALGESRDRAERSDPRRFRSVKPLTARAPNLPRDVVDVVARMMHLDPLQRFQTVTDVRRAVEPLVGRQSATGGAVPAGAGEEGRTAEEGRLPAGTAAVPPPTKGTLMVVEATEPAQRALRSFFASLGYRVLITENPQRALVRFSTTPVPADCLVISAQIIGEPAVVAFNRLAQDPFLANVPAILILGPQQGKLAARAVVDGRRKLVTTPIRSGEIARVLEEMARPAT